VARERAHEELVRLVLVPGEGQLAVAVDLAGGATGRGAWVHGRRPCVERAAQRGLARSARGRVSADATTLGAAIATAAERRLTGLLGAAVGSGQAAVGSTAVERALQHGQIALLLVAQDAAAAASSSGVRDALAHGRAMVWGTRRSLGVLCRGEGSEVAVVGVLSESIAVAVRHALALARSFQAPPRRADEGRESAAPTSPGGVRAPSLDGAVRARRPASH
jgi:predicted RNA-binding protein YlxR (DUF448 family)